MKPNFEPGKDEGVDNLLRQWTVDTPLPPQFQERVWQRIARTETQTQPSLSNAVKHWLESMVFRPKLAYSYIAILLVLGVFSGAWAAQYKSKEVDAALGSRYVQSIDPYAK